MNYKIISAFIVFASFHIYAGEIRDKAKHVFEQIDALDVEHKWPANVHVDWQTGVPDGKTESKSGNHTHCSTFVAAAAKVFGIYILRPPDHSQNFLASAQSDWLQSSKGKELGWTAVENEIAAQESANAGNFVVAVYKNHKQYKLGHIAIVRPTNKTKEEILSNGPQIIQAGMHNYSSTDVKSGFASHPTAFKDHEILYFQHEVQ